MKLLRAIVTCVWLAAVWVGGCSLAFLFFPLVSQLPVWWGAGVGLLVFLGQLAFGERFLRGMLQLEAIPAPSGQLKVLQHRAQCPFVASLGSNPDIVVTAGFMSSCAQHYEEASRWLTEHYSGWYGRLLTSAVALPCLFRAFAAFTAEYGRLRFSQGPLWYFGKFMLFVAHLLEYPLRFQGPDLVVPAELENIEWQSSTSEQAVAWMAGLDVLSFLSWSAIMAKARWQRLTGNSALQHDLPAFTADRWVVWTPWLGLGLGLLLALAPPNLWGAPMCLVGLGLLCASWRYYGRSLSENQDLAQVWAAGRTSGRAQFVELSGQFRPAPNCGVLSGGFWLRLGAGAIELVGLPSSYRVEPSVGSSNDANGVDSQLDQVPVQDSKDLPVALEPASQVVDTQLGGQEKVDPVGQSSQQMKVSGWLLPECGRVLVYSVALGQRRKRSWWVARRRLLWSLVGIFGLLWCLLQVVGL